MGKHRKTPGQNHSGDLNKGLRPWDVPRINIPRLLPPEINLMRRPVDQPVHSALNRFPLNQLKTERLPLQGIRSQRDRILRNLEQPRRVGSRIVIPQIPRQIPGTKSVCQRRFERRTVLFARNIAGKGLRRSPGQGGTYRRTITSQQGCVKYGRR